MRLLEVLIERKAQSLNRPFSYIYNGDKQVDKGYRVLVNFAHKEVVAYVKSVKDTNKTIDELEKKTGFKLQPIIDVIDEKPLLNEELMLLAKKVSNYYLAPEISVLQAMLPTSLKPAKSALKGPKIAYDKYVHVIDGSEEGLTAKQVELLRLIKENVKVLKSEIKSQSVLNKLIDAGKVNIVLVEKQRLNLSPLFKDEKKVLTEDQQSAFESVINTDKTVTLIEGVTGSGKTEVYLSLADYYIKQNKNVLILVPEIALTPVMMSYFVSKFKDKIAILHSELTNAEKYDEYRRIANGKCNIVVGTRSAIFAPLTNIGLIVLDEEHVESYKQDSLPYYHAKDVAIMRAEYYNAKVVLGSATPSLESRARAMKGNYNFVLLSKRINQQELPQTRIIDLSKPYNLTRESFIFSKQLIEELKNVLVRKEQAILLINRRGFSGNITCRNCGHYFVCPDCNIPLTYHKKDNMLKCHHCGHVEFFEDNCPECGSHYFTKSGFGTERIVEEVHKLFPNARVCRLDSDVGEVRNNITKTIKAFLNQEYDVLVGTQMIAKGHDFPNVTLVGAVLADIGLSMPTYRASEITFELITQAVGRSGRANKVGQAIIQTFNPMHYAVLFASRQDYEGFYKKEMGIRKVQQYPPFTYLATLELNGKDEDYVVNTITNIKDEMNKNLTPDVQVLGPVKPYIEKENDNFRRVILVKYKNSDKIKPYLSEILDSLKLNSRLNIRININPYNF